MRLGDQRLLQDPRRRDLRQETPPRPGIRRPETAPLRRRERPSRREAIVVYSVAVGEDIAVRSRTVTFCPPVCTLFGSEITTMMPRFKLRHRLWTFWTARHHFGSCLSPSSSATGRTGWRLPDDAAAAAVALPSSPRILACRQWPQLLAPPLHASWLAGSGP